MFLYASYFVGWMQDYAISAEWYKMSFHISGKQPAVSQVQWKMCHFKKEIHILF